MIKVCINCNAQNLEEAIFCKKCGTKLPTVKEVENSLREDQEEADRKWKEEVEKTKQNNEALNKERRNEGSVVPFGSKTSAVPQKANKARSISKAQMAPQQATTRKSRPKEVEKKSYTKVIITVVSVLVLGALGFFGYKYLTDQGITMDTITAKIKEQSNQFNDKPKENAINIGRESSTFVDSKTGLVWQDDKDSQTVIRDWDEADTYCNNLFLANKSDWRLPLKTELESISDTGNFPAIKDGFMHVSPTHYWGSPIKMGSTFAWHIYFGDGGGSYYETMDSLNSVRCVRED